MLNKNIFFILFIFLIGCGKGFERSCPNTMNISWPSLPATIKSYNLTSQELFALQKAVDKWNNSLQKEYIRIENSSPNKALIGGWSFNGYELAVTNVKGLGGYIYESNIYINPLIYDSDLESVLIHELGHFLGLDHAEGTVMDENLLDYNSYLKIDDISVANIKCLYER